MKVIIQIPCYNEAATLAATLQDLPQSLPGVDRIETMVIDDGSGDGTADVARSLGVTHIVRHNKNLGLAEAFRTGMRTALALNADILVNTDADNQYQGADISLLVQTMLDERADLVIGCRPIKEHPEFSPLKKKLQMLGSLVVRAVSKTTVPDAASGFRAYSRSAMLRLNIVSTFSYCIETIIQAGNSNMKVAYVPIRINPKTRESRLFRNIPHYIWKQAWTIVNMFILYRTGAFFRNIALLLLLPSLFFFYSALNELTEQSCVVCYFLSGFFFLLAFCTYLTGILASLIIAQRKISEETNFHLRCIHFSIDHTQDIDRQS